jgi:class 3 adenylate cyclase
VRRQLSKSLDQPDEVYRFPGVVQYAVVLGDIMVARSTAQPGWRWSKDMRPLVGGEWCQARHVGTIVSGDFVFVLPDGTRTELHPGDVYDIPPGHDGFTLGDEPCTVIEWAGVRAFAGFRAGVTGRHLATLLITDVVDSTATVARLGDVAWNDMVATHFEMARAQLEEFNGREVNTTGDGMFATFDSPVHALRCAASIGERAKRDSLHIRAGVHVGEVEVVGGDVRGVAVHEAARIVAAAKPDEILVSETTRALALASGLTFDDRGVHTLKGIGEIRLFAYCADRGLPAH